MGDSPEVSLAHVLAEMRQTHTHMATLSGRVNKVIGNQTVVAEHTNALHADFENVRAASTQIMQRKDAAEALMGVAMAKLQDLSVAPPAQAPAEPVEQQAPASNKNRLDEQGHSRDASPAASAAAAGG